MGGIDLVDPADAERLYLSDTGVPLARPIMFGDVFRNVPCARGGEAEPLVMVLTHPCSMRHGTKMRKTVVTAQVLLSPPGKVDPQTWQGRFYDYFPLLGFAATDSQTPYAVKLGELHTSSSSDLNLDQREMALSDFGVAAVLQRWIYQLSRDPVPIAELEELIAPPMAEAELQEEWCLAAVAATSGDEPRSTVEGASEAFQAFLGDVGGDTLRQALNSGELSSLAHVRREVRKERLRRYGD